MAKEKKEEVEKKGEYGWDIKRIAIGLITLLILLSLGYYFIGSLEREIVNTPDPHKEALGAISTNDDSDSSEPPLPEKERVENIINNAKETLSKITSENITSSQAAVQKVINDLQELQKQNKEPIDVICEFVCKDR